MLIPNVQHMYKIVIKGQASVEQVSEGEVGNHSSNGLPDQDIITTNHVNIPSASENRNKAHLEIADVVSTPTLNSRSYLRSIEFSNE